MFAGMNLQKFPHVLPLNNRDDFGVRVENWDGHKRKMRVQVLQWVEIGGLVWLHDAHRLLRLDHLENNSAADIHRFILNHIVYHFGSLQSVRKTSDTAFEDVNHSPLGAAKNYTIKIT